MGKDDKFTDAELQEWQRENLGEADSGSKIAEAGHVQRDDAMKAGELPERQEVKINAGYEKLADDALKDSGNSKK